LANVTFVFGTSPNTKPEKKSGGTSHIMSPTWKSGGDTSPVSPTKLRSWCYQISKLFVGL